MKLFAAAFAIALLLAPASGRAQSPPPLATDVPELIAIVAIEGAPEDPALRESFDRGLKLAFDQDVLRTEHLLAGAGYVPGLPLTSHFRQLFGDFTEGAWQVEITIAGVAEPASSRKPGAPPRPVLDVGFVARSPEAKAAELATPVRWTLTAEQPPPSAAAYAGSLGRAVALLVLEELHRRVETLRPEDRVVVFDFERRRSEARGKDDPR